MGYEVFPLFDLGEWYWCHLNAPNAVIPAKAGIQPWTAAYAGVTAWRLFITLGGPRAHGTLSMTGLRREFRRYVLTYGNFLLTWAEQE